MARAVRLELRAEHDGAAGEVAAQAARAAHDLPRLEVRAGAQVLEERAAEVLLDLLLGLLDRDLRQGGDGREVQVLRGVGGRGRPAREHDDGADHLVSRGDGDLEDEVRRDLRGPVRDPVGDVAAHVLEDLLGRQGRGAARHRGGAEPRDDDDDGGARGVGGHAGDVLEAVPAEHGVHHPQVDGPQALDQAGRALPSVRVGSGHCGHGRSSFSYQERGWVLLGGGPAAARRGAPGPGGARRPRGRGGPGGSPRRPPPCGRGTRRRRG